MFILIVVLSVLIFIFYIIHKMAMANAGDQLALAKANDKVNEAEIAALKARINYLNHILVSITVSPESMMKLKYIWEPIVNKIVENDYTPVPTPPKRPSLQISNESYDPPFKRQTLKTHLDDSTMDSLKKL